MRNCQKGKPCGATCITRLKICISEMPQPTQSPLTTTRDKIQEGKRGGGQSLEGKDLDVKRLVDRVGKWQDEHGLRKEFTDGHDETHLLYRDYLGKSSEQIAALMGFKGKGPSMTEEMFVTSIEELAKLPKEQRSGFLRSDQFLQGLYFQLSFAINLFGADILKEEPSFLYRQERVINSTIRILERMIQRPDFDKFAETVMTAKEKAKDYY
jgi:hypothetical protein